jgi:hypothetical protein
MFGKISAKAIGVSVAQTVIATKPQWEGVLLHKESPFLCMKEMNRNETN